MSSTVVIFGAVGRSDQPQAGPGFVSAVPEEAFAAGHARRRLGAAAFSSEEWRNKLTETTQEIHRLRFQSRAMGRVFPAHVLSLGQSRSEAEDFTSLATFLDEVENGGRVDAGLLLRHGSATLPGRADAAGRAGLADESHGPRRIVIEKPFGTDLQSARELNAGVHKVFSEPQVYRIDHYLGKETVQNIMVLRFANTIFEPIWNRNYIDDVQITVAEEVTVGRRAGYYDTAGVMRDMFQNHLLQLLTVTAMEVPSRFEADLVRNEKVKVLQAIRPHDQRRRDREHGARPVRRLSPGARRSAREPDGDLRCV